MLLKASVNTAAVLRAQHYCAKWAHDGRLKARTENLIRARLCAAWTAELESVKRCYPANLCRLLGLPEFFGF
jgi:hypothetical protein